MAESSEQVFPKYPTTAVSDAMNATSNVSTAIKPLQTHYQISGPAVTVRLPVGENGAVLEAIQSAKKGDILVIDAKGDTNRAVAGDFVASMAKMVGIQGFVVDGVVRDLQAMKALDFPVFCRGTTVAAGLKNGGGAVNVPIAIGGIAVLPGDIIVGDADGVVVIPRADFEKVAKGTEDKLAKDEAREKKVLASLESVREYLDNVVKTTPK